MLGRIRRAKQFLASVEETYESVPDRGQPSLARQAYLAQLDPEKGRLWNRHRFPVAAALLLELAYEGRLDVDADGPSTRVTLRDTTPLGCAELDDALLDVGAALFGSKVKRLVGVVDAATFAIERDLTREAVVVPEKHRLLGLVPVRRLRLASSVERDAVVGRVRSALLGTSEPDPRTALLITALGVGAPYRFYVPKQSRKDADRRAAQIRDALEPDSRAILDGVRAAIPTSD